MDVAALIHGAKLPERVTPVCLRPDLVAEYEELDGQRVNAEKATADSLAGNSHVRELADELAALQEQMTDSTVPFKLRALSRNKFRGLAAAHPPRKDEDGKVLDADVVGVNEATFPEALVRACLVDPVLDDELWEALSDKLTDRQYQALVDVAWGLNRHEVDIPFWHAASHNRNGSGPK